MHLKEVNLNTFFLYFWLRLFRTLFHKGKFTFFGTHHGIIQAKKLDLRRAQYSCVHSGTLQLKIEGNGAAYEKKKLRYMIYENRLPLMEIFIKGHQK